MIGIRRYVDGRDFRPAVGEGAGLVKDERMNVRQRFDRLAPFYQNALSCRS